MKHMNVVYNSTEYQMVEQRSSWKGTYTINVSSVGNIDHGSIWIKEAEARSYGHRTDIKSILQRIIDYEKNSKDHA